MNPRIAITNQAEYVAGDPAWKALLRQVATVRRRLMLGSALAALPWCAAFAFALAAAAILWGKLFTPWAQWSTLLGAATGLTLMSTAAWGRWTRPSTAAAAVELDRRCKLDERVSSALAAHQAAGLLEFGVDTSHAVAAAEAVRLDAQRRLETVDAHAAFPLVAPRRHWRPLVPAALAVIAALAWSPRPNDATSVESEDAAAVHVQENAVALEKKLDDAKSEAQRLQLAEAMRLLEQLKEESRKLQSGKPLTKKEALLQLSDMTSELQERREEVERSEQLQQALRRMQSKKQGPGDALAEALRRGDFAAAAEQLQRLQRELESNKMDAAAKQSLAEQLADLKQQLEQLAAADREEQKKLEQRQFEAAESQKDKASQSASQSASEASQLAEQLSQFTTRSGELDELGQAMKQASQNLKSGKPEQAQESLRSLEQLLQRSAKHAEENSLLTKTLRDVAECKACIAAGAEPSESQSGGREQQQAGRGSGGDQAAREGESGQQGQGARSQGTQSQGTPSQEPNGRPGGSSPGKGIGPGLAKDAAPDEPSSGGFESRVRGQIGAGPMRGAGPADGPNAKGNALETIRKQAETVRAGGDAQKLENQPLDRSRRQQKKQYFDSLREQR